MNGIIEKFNKATLGRSKPLLVLISVFLLFAFFTIGLSACAQGQAEEDIILPTPLPAPETPPPAPPPPTPEETPEPEPEPEETPEPEPQDTGTVSPLTGMPVSEAVQNTRPLAIMIANTQESLPMNGLSQAALVWEIPVEGGLTRIMAMFQNYENLNTVGSIRSVRHYYVEIAAGYDAILLASGGSSGAIEAIRDLGVTSALEGSATLGGVFTRNQNRVSGRRFQSYRSVITNGERLMRVLPGSGLRLEYENRERHTFGNFSEDAVLQNASPADQIVVRFSNAKSSTFNFNADDNLYTMSQYGGTFTDANNGNAIRFANVIVLRTPISPLTGPHGGSGRVDMPTTGNGTGFIAHGGEIEEIRWSRANVNSPFVFTRADGSEVDLAIGRSYIAVIATAATASVTYS